MLLRGLQTGEGLLGKERREMKPIEEMTGLELREAVAVEVMGWTRDEDGWDDNGRLVVDEPWFESSIEAAFEMQAKVCEDPQLKDAYACALEQLMRDKMRAERKGQQVNSTSIFEAQLKERLILADATDRCRAALKAVRAK